MGFLKQMKDMKNTLHEAPGMIAQAQELGAQAQAYAQAQQAMAGGLGAPGAATVTAADLEPISGISLERYAQLAKAVGTRKLQGPELDAFLAGNGHSAAAWQAAYDGWNARMRNNMGLSTQYGTLYQSAVAL
jgi:phosphoserine phosphatase